MNAEILTTGTEILLGEIVDTNAAWLARRLRELGINLYYKTTVGDNEGRITEAMRQGLQRSDLVLVTGGLGPTVDDVTRDAAARAVGRELVLHPDCLADMEALFARWGRPVHGNNRRQAFLPEGAVPIRNPVGTAPGFIVEVPRVAPSSPALLICLPGVPREMKHLMEHVVEPFLVQRLGSDRVIIRSRTLRTIGIGESAIDARIADLMRAANPTVGLAAHPGQVDVRITARAASLEQADTMIERVAGEVRTRLGALVYGEGEESLEQVVASKLETAGYSLAILETNSGGEIARRLLAVRTAEPVIRAAYVLASPGELLALAQPGGSPGSLSSIPALERQSGVGHRDTELDPQPAESWYPSQEVADWAAQWLLGETISGTMDRDIKWELAQERSAAERGEGRERVILALAVCGSMDAAAGPYGAYRGETYLALSRSAPANQGGSHQCCRRQRVGVGGTEEVAQQWTSNAALNAVRLWLEEEGW